jgi:AcrR family transcriptional regulator
MAHTRVRLDPDTRREQLLDLGVALLATRSLDELSIDLLAEEAGISRGLLYHYFRNKQEFHRAVVRRATDEMLALTTPDPTLDPLTRLTAGLAAYIDYVAANFEPFMSLVRGAASGDRFLREIYEDARGALTTRIVDSLGELGVEDTPAARLLTDGWAAMVEETVILWAQPPQQESRSRPESVRAAAEVSRDELIGLLATALPAVLGAGTQPAKP